MEKEDARDRFPDHLAASLYEAAARGGVRYVVLKKRGMVALLALVADEKFGIIFRVDPRERVPTWRTYPSGPVAASWFERSLASSIVNGWLAVYDGRELTDTPDRDEPFTAVVSLTRSLFRRGDDGAPRVTLLCAGGGLMLLGVAVVGESHAFVRFESREGETPVLDCERFADGAQARGAMRAARASLVAEAGCGGGEWAIFYQGPPIFG